jgi:enterochelin esterase family protein
MVTWVWEGDDPPLLSGDWVRWAEYTEPRRSEPGVWIWTTELPEDAYVEYAFFAEPDDPDARVTDPLARTRVWNGIDGWNHSVRMPRRPPRPRRRRGGRRGIVTRHEVQDRFVLTGRRRAVWLYAPAAHDGDLPLLVVHDGNDYLRRGSIIATADTLIDRGAVAPFAMALIGNSRHGRFAEYCAADGMLVVLEQLVLPLVRRHLPIRERGHAVLGASMGGLQALHTVMRWPERFTTALSQAGAIGHRFPDEIPSLPEVLLDAGTPPGMRIWQQVGTMDFLYEANMAIAPRLQTAAAEHRLLVTHDAHAYGAWRDWLPDGLRFAFGQETSS